MLRARSLPGWELVRAFLHALLLHENPNRNQVELAAEIGRWQKQWIEVYKSQTAAENSHGTGHSATAVANPRTSEPPIPSVMTTSARFVTETNNRPAGTPGATARNDRRATERPRRTSLLPVGDEAVLRQEIFEHLAELVEETGTVTRQQLSEFTVNGQLHRLIDRNRGIYNPSYLHATLSVLSIAESRYGFADEDLGDSLFSYAYREGTIEGDNQRLRKALELQLPIILLRKIGTGVYVPVFPVYVVADDRANRRFLLSMDDGLPNPLQLQPHERRYAQRLMKERLYQPEFRARVLRAYDFRCAVCGLGHGALLEAAYISPNASISSSSDLDNGLSLCKIHHAAFDANLLGIAPDHQIRISKKLQHETGDHMLHYVLQTMHGRSLRLPSRRQDRPSSERLEERFKDFEKADM